MHFNLANVCHRRRLVFTAEIAEEIVPGPRLPVVRSLASSIATAASIPLLYKPAATC